MKFLRAIMGRPRETESEMHASEKISGCRIYRIKFREKNCGGLDMSKEWVSTECQKEYWKRR
jgi:hypothetical protein